MSEPIVFDGAAANWCAERRLSDVDARVLAYLCSQAKRGTVIGYYATAAAVAAGFGGKSGRRTFGRSVDRLAEAGALKVLVRPWGHDAGKLEIICFEELKDMARATRRASARTMSPAGEIPVLARADGPISRAPLPPGARARWETRATSPVARAAGFVPRAPAHGGVLPSEELSPSTALHPEEEEEEEEQISGRCEKLRLAIVAKTGQVVTGRLRDAVSRLASNGTPIGFLLDAVAAAPADLRPPRIVDEWLPDAIRLGSVPGHHDTPEPDAETRRRLTLVEEDIARYRSLGGDEPPDYVIRQRDELLRLLEAETR